MKRFGVVLGLMIFGVMHNCYSMQKLPKKALLAYQKTKKDFSKESIKKWNKGLAIGASMVPPIILFGLGELHGEGYGLNSYFHPGGVGIVGLACVAVVGVEAFVVSELKGPFGLYIALNSAAYMTGRYIGKKRLEKERN